LLLLRSAGGEHRRCAHDRFSRGNGRIASPAIAETVFSQAVEFVVTSSKFGGVFVD